MASSQNKNINVNVWDNIWQSIELKTAIYIIWQIYRVTPNIMQKEPLFFPPFPDLSSISLCSALHLSILPL